MYKVTIEGEDTVIRIKREMMGRNPSPTPGPGESIRGSGEK